MFRSLGTTRWAGPGHSVSLCSLPSAELFGQHNRTTPILHVALGPDKSRYRTCGLGQNFTCPISPNQASRKVLVRWNKTPLSGVLREACLSSPCIGTYALCLQL